MTRMSAGRSGQTTADSILCFQGVLSMVGKTLRAAALASTCLWPLTGWAADDDFDLDAPAAAALPSSKPVLLNEAGMEAGYQTGGSAQFGRYTGHNGQGATGAAWFHMLERATGKDDGTLYFQADGENIDFSENTLLPNAGLRLRVGEQGVWDARLAYQGTPFVQSDTFQTVLGSSGELLNGLQARSLNSTATNASGDALLRRYLSTRSTGTQRDKVSGAVSYSGIPDWKFATDIAHEHKQGTKINAYMFVSNSSFLSFPEPIDYDTDRFSASAEYTTRPFQAKLSYILSNFTNNQTDFQVTTPFSNATFTGYTKSQYSLPPSNQEHRVKGQFGFNPSETSHVALNLSYALQLQNEEYKTRSYDRTPTISENAYDGQINHTYANVAFTSRPLKDWNFRTTYTLDMRENHGSRYRTGAPLRSDTTSVFNGASGVTTNTPYSFLNQRADGEVGYRILRSTKLTANYSYTDRQRDYSVTSRNQESTVGGKLSSTLAGNLTGTVGYNRGIRQATQYLGNAGWAELGRNLSGNTSEAELRMFSYAARKRDEWKGDLNWAFADAASLGGTLRYVHDDFPDSYYGVQANDMLSIGPDVSFSPVKDVTAHFYYTYQENFTDTVMNTTANTNGAVWQLKNRDTVHSAGAGSEWKVSDRLKLSLENNISYGNTAFEEASWFHGSVAATTVNTAVSLPTSKSVTNTLKVSGEYELVDNVFVGLSGLWERFLSTDYLNDEQAVSTTNTTGTASTAATGNPSYSVGVVLATMRMKW